ncbi:hypothetical protein PHYSODRAFT_300881 [Phytophthora sojae]|uniref:RxLR effector protein n=1 Tax=Phytophthora sojae (strain P6497) TaxID=1094619 RepID=G4ZGX8_PHYSP|nr:hypothetical protein PHYSODRAFT_300881 [Phytophthora sojae]EGZ18044.1 hypothetical protein PHYSODRAFT_300881 [Phytophthora sojae]|eukprot:XP_009527102.1 hypothetical protein PHYSODRAFT_300881 [Phytophthora sojae]
MRLTIFLLLVVLLAGVYAQSTAKEMRQVSRTEPPLEGNGGELKSQEEGVRCDTEERNTNVLSAKVKKWGKSIPGTPAYKAAKALQKEKEDKLYRMYAQGMLDDDLFTLFRRWYEKDMSYGP